jgi:hypothetical protein
MAIDQQALVLELARGIVRANQSEYPDRPAEEWTEVELFAAGFWADAESFLDTMRRLNYFVGSHQEPTKSETDVIASALAKAFPRYERLPIEEAAKRVVAALQANNHVVRPVIHIKAA